jgi:hypothetical protein
MTKAQAAGNRTARTKLWRRVLHSVSISGPVGLLPYLGKLDFPVLRQLVELYPESIANVAILFSTAAMSVVAAYVQFHGSDRIILENIDQKFRFGVRSFAVALVLLMSLYFLTVTPVHYKFHGEARTTSFVTGFTGTGDPRCAGMSREDCILHEPKLDEGHIASIFGEWQIRFASILIVGVYIVLAASFGYLQGLRVLGNYLQKKVERRRRS